MDNWNKRPDFIVSVDGFDELLELSQRMSYDMRKRVEDIVHDFEGDYEDFIAYVAAEYEKCWIAKFGEKPWNPYIDLFFVGRWIFEDDKKFKEMCLYFQEQGWLYNWY